MSHRSEGAAESAQKIEEIRTILRAHGCSGVRLQGTDWFTWVTAGASPTVLLTAETGIAEAVITAEHAWIVTDEIEAERLAQEELPQAGWEILAFPWAARRSSVQRFMKGLERAGSRIASDRPGAGESALPEQLLARRRRLGASELVRYRNLATDAAQAMTETLQHCRPDWTEWQLAGAGAERLWQRGIHPALVLAAGDRRVARFRHPTPSSEPLGRRAMLVFCARRWGLYANITRFVYFEAPTAAESQRIAEVAAIEAAALAASRPGTRLDEIYRRLDAAYERFGYPAEIRRHHQGGTTGYLSRETVAQPDSSEVLEEGSALAWNPSLPGAKIEDTVVTTSHGIEFLTVDPAWPTIEVEGRSRPDILRRLS